MYVKIGHARHDENGHSTGGIAGDQNSEVAITDWYAHPKKWFVFRCKDEKYRLRIAEAMQKACNNKNIGYDQHQRNTLFEAARKYHYDPGLIKYRVETDCSALVRVCVAYAFGKDILGDVRTVNLPQKLMATKKFEKYSSDKFIKQPIFLKAGDILCTQTKGHTVVVLTNGSQTIGIRTATNFNHKMIGTFVTAANVNLRVGAGTQEPRIMTIPKGTKVECTGYYRLDASNGKVWPQIYFQLGVESFRGYCSGAYLKA